MRIAYNVTMCSGSAGHNINKENIHTTIGGLTSLANYMNLPGSVAALSAIIVPVWAFGAAERKEKRFWNYMHDHNYASNKRTMAYRNDVCFREIN